MLRVGCALCISTENPQAIRQVLGLPANHPGRRIRIGKAAETALYFQQVAWFRRTAPRALPEPWRSWQNRFAGAADWCWKGKKMNPANQGRSALRIIREARGRVPGDGVELAFGYWPGRGAPVVALHGLTASYLNFIGIAEQLAGRLPVLAFDLRGRGDSDKPEGPYGITQHARDVAAAMRAMGLGASIVTGHSMGAFVATALALEEPTLVSGLILIDGGCVLDTPAGVTPDQGLNPALALRIAQLRQTYPSRKDYREFWRAQPHFPPGEWNRWVEAFLDYEVGGESPVQPKASEAAVRADVGEAFQRDAILGRLKSIRVPTMLLRAESGFTPDQPPLYPDRVVAQIRTCVPHIADHKFAGTTHYTVVLGERGAGKIADLICEMAGQNLASPARWAS
jgi:lipase